MQAVIRGALIALIAVGFTALIATEPAGAAPVNDAFANAAAVASVPFSGVQDTSTATMQSGEPQPCPVDVGRTVWYAFTAPSSATYIVDTYGSNFDTILTAYTGTTLSSLNKIECSDDTLSRSQSRLALQASAGVTYRIQAGGWDGASGSLHLNIAAAPPIPANDDFAEAQTVTQVPFGDIAFNFAATNEGGEPRTACSDSEQTVWYRFVPPSTGQYQIDTMGSDFDTVLTVQTGTAFNNLNEIACHDDVIFAQVETSRLVLQLNAGVDYRIQAGGFSAAIAGLGTDYGRLAFNIRVPLPGDTDADGCSDAQESGGDPVFGGGRSIYDAWDFFEVTGDRAIDVADNVRILQHFGHEAGVDAQDALLDRFIPDSSAPHRTAAATGTNVGIDIADLVTNLASFGHRCAGGGPVPTPTSPGGTATATATRTPMPAATATPAGCLDTDGDGQCNSVDADDDNDGCSDTSEGGIDPAKGGDRNPLDFWDFFDVTGDGAVGVDDVVDTLQYWGDAGTSPEANLRDRWSPDPGKPWRSAAADNGIDVTDTLTSLASFGHACQ
jgi:hypothetical protein